MGLGHNFLRHIERTNILIHVLDVSGIEGGRDPKADFDAINEELRKYSEKLANKKQIVALNKIDLVFDDTTILIRRNILKIRDMRCSSSMLSAVTV